MNWWKTRKAEADLWKARKPEARRIAESVGESVTKRAPDALLALWACNDEFEVVGSDGHTYSVVVEGWKEVGDDSKILIDVIVMDGSTRAARYPAAWSEWVPLESHES